MLTHSTVREALDANNQANKGIALLVSSHGTEELMFLAEEAAKDEARIEQGEDLLYPGVRRDVASRLGVAVSDEQFNRLFNEVAV